MVWLRSLGTQGTLCSSALELDGQANPGVNESSLHGSFHPGIKGLLRAQVSEPWCDRRRAATSEAEAQTQVPGRISRRRVRVAAAPPARSTAKLLAPCAKAPLPRAERAGPLGLCLALFLICLCYVLPQPGWEARQYNHSSL